MASRSAGISFAFLTSDTHRRFSRSIFGSNLGKSKSSTSVFGWTLVPTLNHSPPRRTEAVRISAEDQTDSSSDHNAVNRWSGVESGPVTALLFPRWAKYPASEFRAHPGNFIPSTQ